jgi:predicted negative regulator of RcsB-dependent stress response
MSIKNLSKKQKQSIYLLAGIIVIALILTVMYQLYSSSSNKKMLEASSAYQKALIANENTKLPLNDKASKFQIVIDNYPNTSFGIFASWQLSDLYITPTKLNTTSFNLNIANMPKAINILQQSINANPNDSLTNVTKTRLARLYIQTKQPDKAIEILKTVHSLDKSAYPLMFLGQAYSEKGDNKKAIEIWQKALKDPNISPEFKQIITQFINNN